MTEKGFLSILIIQDYVNQIKCTDVQIICLQGTMPTGNKELETLDWKTNQVTRSIGKRGGDALNRMKNRKMQMQKNSKNIVQNTK